MEAMMVDDTDANSDSGLGSDYSSGMESITSENYAFRWDGTRRYFRLFLLQLIPPRIVTTA